MKAIVHHNYGSPDVLQCEEIAMPIPGDHEILVKIRAASLNPADWYRMKGRPYVFRTQTGLRQPKETRTGVDFSGTVEAIGKNVTHFKPGDDVFGGRTGALAEYVCVHEDRAVALKPDNVTFEQAGAVAIAGLTALQGLRDKAKIQPGQKILINGAAGGVGTFSVQIAKALGAHVTGVCSTKNVDLVRSIGADRVIDYTNEDFTKSREIYDVIFDNAGSRSLSECKRILHPKGIYVMVGAPKKGRWIGPLARVLRMLVLSRFVSQKLIFFVAQMKKEDLNYLSDLMQAGKVTPVVDKCYKLSEVVEAMRYLETGHARGKVVVTL